MMNNKKARPYIETLDYIPTEPAQCNSCKHYEGFGICPAFPGGIPSEIVSNEVKHDERLTGQQGYWIWQV
jgi:hypothetical protein